MPELWTPGMAGPLDDLVARIHRRIESFAAEHGLEQAIWAGPQGLGGLPSLP